LGMNRARYFLMTGQTLNAQECKDLGLVSEILPRAELLPRARALASGLLKKNPLMLRYTRNLLVHPIKTAVHELLGYGLALEGLAVVDQGQKI
ncbi:MAG: enoyl-CoA hydratase-related protein, partial [Gammaproteobacteria bacterium]|nr:enoyl-CoA hydratase-related protein [Gammaproteobacteria bacterium]